MSRHLCILAAFLLFVPAPLWALNNMDSPGQNDPATFDGVTLIKYDGWTYKNISLKPDTDKYSLNILRSDGAVLKVAVNGISKILDNQGNNITTTVFSAFHCEPARVWDPAYDEFGLEIEPDEAPNSSSGSWVYQEDDSPRMFDFMLAAGLGYGALGGSFYEGLDGGLLYFGEVCISYDSRKYLRLGYRSVRAYEGTLMFHDYDTGTIIDIKTTMDIRQYSITTGWLSRPNNKNTIRVYGEMGIALGDHIVSVEENDYNEKTASEKRVLFLIKAGAMIPIKDRMGIDLGVSLGTKTYSGNDNEDMGFLFDGHIGLMVQFGGD